MEIFFNLTVFQEVIKIMDNLQCVNDAIREYEQFKQEVDRKDKQRSEEVSVSIPVAANKAVQTGRALNNEHINLYKSLDPAHLNGSPNQKHGCAAERQQVHDSNVEKIQNGQEPDTRLSDSGIDPKVDIIDGSTNYQMKFCKTPKDTFKAFMDGDYEGIKKYCPKGQANDNGNQAGIKTIAKKAAEDFKAKAKQCKANGDMQGYKENMAKANKALDIANTVEDSSVTYDQSKTIIADKTKNVILSVAKDCHKAGVESAKSGAMISAVFSGGQNMIEVFKGEKELSEAIMDTIKETAVSTAKAYAVGSTSTLLATGAQQGAKALTNFAASASNSAVSAAASNSASVLNAFSKSCAPAMVIVGAVEFTKSVYNYSRGLMTKEELCIELGRKTVGIVSSTIVGTAATALFAPLGPLAPLAGAAVSMLVYSITTAFYDSVVETIKLAKRREETLRLTAMYKEAYEQLCQSRRELLQFLSQQTQLRKSITEESLRNIEISIFEGDFLKMNSNLGRILDIYADGLLFKNKNEFDRAMHSGTLIKI